MPEQTTSSIEINAAPDHVWRVLTEPEFTEKYMFGCRTVSDWQVGSPLTWEGVFDGKKLVAVKGGIVVLERPRRLHYTVFDPNANYVDEPRNYLHITYALTPVVRKDALDAAPKLADLLNGLAAKLDDSTMAKLNASIDVDKKTIEDVAASFLKDQKLI